MPKKIETIQRQIERCEASLAKAVENEIRVLNNRGWGYGMRHAKIGFSTRKSDKLKSRLENLKQELRIAKQKTI